MFLLYYLIILFFRLKFVQFFIAFTESPPFPIYSGRSPMKHFDSCWFLNLTYYLIN